MEFVHVESEDELPQRLGLSADEKDKVGVSITSMYDIEDRKYEQSDDKKALLLCLEQDMQETNENICRNIEDILFEERYAHAFYYCLYSWNRIFLSREKNRWVKSHVGVCWRFCSITGYNLV